MKRLTLLTASVFAYSAACYAEFTPLEKAPTDAKTSTSSVAASAVTTPKAEAPKADQKSDAPKADAGKPSQQQTAKSSEKKAPEVSNLNLDTAIAAAKSKESKSHQTSTKERRSRNQSDAQFENDRSTARLQTEPKVGESLETPLPGVGKLPGSKQLMKANIVRVGSEANEIIYVSARFQNRISTPFARPRIIDTNQATVVVEGQDVYVIMKSTDPIVLFVKSDNPNDPVTSLTLVPKDIPSQTIVLQLDNSGKGQQEEDVVANNYTDRIRALMRTVALGKTPSGYTIGSLPASMGRVGNLIIIPELRYSSSNSDIYRYRIETTSTTPVELMEASFYQTGVRAVSIVPRVKLIKGESTTVFVLTDKSALSNSGTVSTPLRSQE